MKQRQLLVVVALTAAMPVPVLASIYAGAVLPLVPACIASGIICFTSFFAYFRAFWKLIQD